MVTSGERLRIEPSELATGKPIRIESSQVTPVPAILLDEPAPKRSSRKAWAVLSVAAILGLLATITVAVLANNRPAKRDRWMEGIPALADKSIVRIEMGDGLGTGFVVASDGDKHLVLTNRHVVGEVQTVHVRLRLCAQIEGQVVGQPIDEGVDLVLLLVESPRLQPLGPIAAFGSVRPAPKWRRSVIRWGSTSRSPTESFPPNATGCCSKPPPPSAPAIAADRCCITTARWWALTRWW